MNNVIRRGPAVGLSSFDDFDRLFNDLLESFTGPSASKYMPGADIYSEDDKHIMIELTAPGFSHDDIEINIRNSVLEISGERSEKENQGSKRSYIARSSSSSFARRVLLPEGVDTDNITADLENGVLKVTLPIQRPEAKRVKITSRKNTPNKRLKTLGN